MRFELKGRVSTSDNQELYFAPVQWEMTFRYLSANVE